MKKDEQNVSDMLDKTTLTPDQKFQKQLRASLKKQSKQSPRKYMPAVFASGMVAAAALLLLYGRQWRRGGDRSRRPRAVGRRRDVLRDRLVTLDAGGASAEWRVVTQRRRGRR